MINQVGCAIVALDRNDPYRVLLGKRNKEFGRDLWVLPGGSHEGRETTVECVKRETQEEVGLTLIDPRPCYHEWLPEKGGYLMLYFSESVNPKDVKLVAAHEFSELAFWDAHDLPEAMWPSDRNAIFAAFAQCGVARGVS